MSRLQQNKHKKEQAYRAWSMLIGCAFFVHGLFLGFLFFNCCDTLDFFELSLSHTSRTTLPVFFTSLPVQQKIKTTSFVDTTKDIVQQLVPKRKLEKELIKDQEQQQEVEKIVEHKKEIEKNNATDKDETIEQKDYKQLHAERDLYQLISQKWHPPFGVTVTSDCVVTGLVNQHGVIEITDLQSSGVLIFDIAVRSALQKMVLPPWAYEKTLTIHFA